MPSLPDTAMTRFPRRVLRLVRHAGDRLLHARRRRRVLERLRRETPPESALVICLGNINRSAFAAAAFERAVEDGGAGPIRIRSAGFIGPGRPSPSLALETAAARGIDLSNHRSRVVDPDEVTGTDLVVVMDAAQRRRLSRMTGRARGDIIVLGDLDPVRIVRRVVQDPYGHPAPVFERVFDRVERCVTQLADAVSVAGRTSPSDNPAPRQASQ